MALSDDERRDLMRHIRARARALPDIDQAVSPVTESEVRNRHAPLVICYGAGVDSTALLVELVRRNVRPDLILFADTGAEKPETYAFLPLFTEYLVAHGFPAVTTVRLTGQKWRNLEHQCLDTRQLPSLAFGGHSCSVKWKILPQHYYCRNWEPALRAWSGGQRLIKAVGYDASAADQRRSCRTFVTAANRTDYLYYRFWYPLQEWNLTREDCISIIRYTGIEPPPKSSCHFCPAMKRHEVVQISRANPDLFSRALAIEDTFRQGPHYRPPDTGADGKLRRGTEGLGRNWSWRSFYESGFEYPADRRRRLREERLFPLFANQINSSIPAEVK